MSLACLSGASLSSVRYKDFSMKAEKERRNSG